MTRGRLPPAARLPVASSQYSKALQELLGILGWGVWLWATPGASTLVIKGMCQLMAHHHTDATKV